jgi:hypothetical protein
VLLVIRIFETAAQAAVNRTLRTDEFDIFSAIKEGSSTAVFCALVLDGEVINARDTRCGPSHSLRLLFLPIQTEKLLALLRSEPFTACKFFCPPPFVLKN